MRNADIKTHGSKIRVSGGDMVTFTYDLLDATAQGTIAIKDASGRQVALLPITTGHGQQLWDVRGTAPGVYLVEYAAGEVRHMERLIIQ